MRYVTAGESHGPELTAIIEGIPAGLTLSVKQVNADLARRQQGYGRGNRMKIEQDKVIVTSGVRHQMTLGSPITLQIKNHDYIHWQKIMAADEPATAANRVRQVVKPRPGHADLVGGQKYQHQDLRNVLERSSARETAARVAVGSVCKQLLNEIGVDILGFVQQLGGVESDETQLQALASLTELRQLTENSDVRTYDSAAAQKMRQLIQQTRQAGDTLGGVVEVIATHVPVGLGSYVSATTKLDAKLAQAIISINAFKGVEFGDGFALTQHPGSQVMDEIYYAKQRGFYRGSDHLGGFEGGMTTGAPLIIKGTMKPIPTLYQPLDSVNIKTKQKEKASVQRADTTAVPAAAVVAEAMVAITLAQAVLAQFNGDSLIRLKKQVAAYRKEIAAY